jgi:frataxin-like iron-binding protein CyaY
MEARFGRRPEAQSVWALAPEEVNDYVINLQEPHAQAWLTFVIKDLNKG